MKSTYLTNTMG